MTSVLTLLIQSWLISAAFVLLVDRYRFNSRMDIDELIVISFFGAVILMFAIWPYTFQEIR